MPVLFGILTTPGYLPMGKSAYTKKYLGSGAYLKEVGITFFLNRVP